MYTPLIAPAIGLNRPVLSACRAGSACIQFIYGSLTALRIRCCYRIALLGDTRMNVDHRVRRRALFEVLAKRPLSESTALSYASLTELWSGVGLRMMDLQLCIEELSAAGLLRVSLEQERVDWLIAPTPTGVRYLSRHHALFSLAHLRNRQSLPRPRPRARRQWPRTSACSPQPHDRPHSP